MSCCCQNSLDLGCINPCLPLQISYIAPADGTYILELDSGIRTDQISATIDAGEPLIFDLEGINEDMTFQAKIYLGGAAPSFKDAADTVFDCFTFTTKIGTVANEDSPILTLV